MLFQTTTCINYRKLYTENFDRKLYTEKPNTNFLKKSFSYRGAVSWNSLPSEIVDVHDQLSLLSFTTITNHYYKDLEKNTSTI